MNVLPRQLMVFLGSGVSIPSGMPSTQQITEHILSDGYFRFTEGSYLPKPKQPMSSHPTREEYKQYSAYENAFQDKDTIQARELLFHMKSHAEALGMQLTYEDMYYLTEQMLADIQGKLCSPDVRDYRVTMENKIDGEFEQVLINALERIRNILLCLLGHTSELKGFGTLVELLKSPDTERCDIVTLNHDTLIDRALRENVIDHVDGFAMTDGDLQYIEIVQLQKAHRVGLLKLHGSVDWNYAICPQTKTYRFCRTNSNIQHDSSKRLHFTFSRACAVLVGTYNKLAEYNFGLTFDFFLIFRTWLKFHTTMVVSGYGWGDFGINRLLFDWLEEREANRIILLHHDITELHKDARESLMSVIEKGKIRHVPKWLCETTLADIFTS